MTSIAFAIYSRKPNACSIRNSACSSPLLLCKVKSTVQLDWIYARESISKLSGTVEDATGICIVGFRGHLILHLPLFQLPLVEGRISSSLATH